MNLKQFLKPDRMKVILTILLLVLLASSFVFITITVYPLVLLAPPVMLLLYQYGGEGYYTVEPALVILLFIIEIVYLYLLSCFIIWIYNKVKKK